MGNNPVLWVLLILAGVFGVYLLFRIATAAYFQSRRDYEERKQNGQRQSRS